MTSCEKLHEQHSRVQSNPFKINYSTAVAVKYLLLPTEHELLKVRDQVILPYRPHFQGSEYFLQVTFISHSNSEIPHSQEGLEIATNATRVTTSAEELGTMSEITVSIRPARGLAFLS